MGKIIYKKMSLFDAPKESILVHACNGQGIWGSGIAKEFKERFPESYSQYFWYCSYVGQDVLGTVLITEKENNYKVACLITSDNFGNKVSNEETILKNTKNALNDLTDYGLESIYYSNKFNSGLFKVPWKKTESILQEFIDKYDIDWIVCDPEMKENEK